LVADPLDGTTNFAHGFFVFSISIGLVEEGKIIAGVVHAPALNETYTALYGQGAMLNKKHIHVSTTAKLSESLLSTGFPYDIKTARFNNLEQFSAFAKAAQGVRRVGSASLDLCFTAAGRFDGFWEFGLKPWDMAAGALIVSEAGGLATDTAGVPLDLNSGRILATNGLIHNEMIEIIQKTMRE